MTNVQAFRIAVLILIGIVAIVLVATNTHTTQLNLLVWTMHLPVFLLVPGLLLLGFLAGYLTRMVVVGRASRQAGPEGPPLPAEKG